MTKSDPCQEVGTPVPENTPHAVSVSLPTWKAVVGYEEGQSWVADKMQTGYPRFFIHNVIRELMSKVEDKYGKEGEKSLVFPTYKVAKRCREFMKNNSGNPNIPIRILQLSTPAPVVGFEDPSHIETEFAVLFFPEEAFPFAKAYWVHTGEGISSRMGDYLLRNLFSNKQHSSMSGGLSKQEKQAQNILRNSPSLSKGLKSPSFSLNEDVEKDFNTFIEQKYGRVLDLQFADQAKLALRRRICGKLDGSDNHLDEVQQAKRGIVINESEVYLFPTGMTAIFGAHQAVLGITRPNKKTICFGFPYVDTTNILKKFGPGMHFYGFGDDSSLADIEKNLEENKLEIQALICECPSNPLLKTPNLPKIRQLADKYNFVVIVDETIGNFFNINVLPYADIVVSSLTKVFSGDSNVMGGSLVLNTKLPFYSSLKKYFDSEYEDILWPEDALYLERNSRDFCNRSAKINENALAVVDFLLKSPYIAQVFYPTLLPSRKYYDEIKSPEGGYGGLLSFSFHNPSHAVAFFDSLKLYKGPSLGTNFSLACPYAVLAHYNELDEVTKWGIDKYLIRVSVGLEDQNDLLETFADSMNACKT